MYCVQLFSGETLLMVSLITWDKLENVGARQAGRSWACELNNQQTALY